MKKLVFVVSFLFTATVLFAQKMPLFELGVKAGANITKIDGKSFSNEFKYGYSLGAFAEIRLGDKWQIQPEVLFNQFNTRADSSYSALYDKKNFKNVSLNYLSIPILLNFSPVKFFTLQAGPQYGILINKHDNLLTNGRTAFTNGDFSMVGGVQLNIANFKVSGRYYVGLNNISDLDNREKWKNQGFQVSVGMRIL